MNEKLMMLLATDAMLLEMDDDYEGVPKEQCDLIHAKLLEGYGFSITAPKEEWIKAKEMLIKDVRKFREDLLSQIVE